MLDIKLILLGVVVLVSSYLTISYNIEINNLENQLITANLEYSELQKVLDNQNRQIENLRLDTNAKEYLSSINKELDNNTTTTIDNIQQQLNNNINGITILENLLKGFANE